MGRSRVGSTLAVAGGGPTPHTRGMDTERDDYADRDLPPPRPRPILGVLLWLAILLLVVATLVIGAASSGPRFD